MPTSTQVPTTGTYTKTQIKAYIKSVNDILLSYSYRNELTPLTRFAITLDSYTVIKTAGYNVAVYTLTDSAYPDEKLQASTRIWTDGSKAPTKLFTDYTDNGVGQILARALSFAEEHCLYI